MKTARAVIATLVLCLLISCKSDGPTKALFEFLESVRAGDTKAAWKRLSKRSQESLRSQAKALEKATGGVVKREPKEMLLITALRARADKRSVRTLKADDNSAVLRLTLEDGSEDDVSMVKEDGSWRLELGTRPATGAPAQPPPKAG